MLTQQTPIGSGFGASVAHRPRGDGQDCNGTCSVRAPMRLLCVQVLESDRGPHLLEIRLEPLEDGVADAPL